MFKFICLNRIFNLVRAYYFIQKLNFNLICARINSDANEFSFDIVGLHCILHALYIKILKENDSTWSVFAWNSSVILVES